MYKCVDCGSNKIYKLEFRTDYAKPRLLYPVNEGIKDITNNTLPYRLDGYYCHDCREFCSAKFYPTEMGNEK